MTIKLREQSKTDEFEGQGRNDIIEKKLLELAKRTKMNKNYQVEEKSI